MISKVTTLFLLLNFPVAIREAHFFTAQANSNQTEFTQKEITKTNSWGYVRPVGRTQRLIHLNNSGGRRECDSNSTPIDLNLITPNDHIATTVSGRPNFLWHVSAPALMSFALAEPGVSKPILEKQLNIKKAGIVQLELAQEIPELAEGKEYRWTVSIICNENRPSENIYARSWIKRVPTTPNLVKELGVATQARERAAVYAQNGVWFDAISSMWRACITSPTERTNFQVFNRLLNQVNIDL